MFTVHKKTKQTDDGLVDLQRLIFDLRRVNMFFSTPPSCAMGSLSALAAVDLSDRVVGDREIVGIVGDVPDFYYRILSALTMTGYFGLRAFAHASFSPRSRLRVSTLQNC